MGDVRGFLKVRRKEAAYRPVCERVKDFEEVILPTPPKEAEYQASRCMDCGVPFCHWGCPVGNHIPEWNDMVFRQDWENAFKMLAATNNFPEITGRICPAACEQACVLGINDEPVTIRENELSIIEKAFGSGMVKPNIPEKRTGKKISVIGSGPAGLACSDQLNKAGHSVTVYEKDDRPGGLLRYGIPNFKLEKKVLDRRIDLMAAEGIKFISGVEVGKDIALEDVMRQSDAVCLAPGSGRPRDINIEGRELEGIHFAMDYLTQGNRIAGGEAIDPREFISAKGKKVVVIGGGDTGSDCVGTANRQGAECVVQIELMPKPGECRGEEHPWPMYPTLLRTSSSHEEGVIRDWSVLTKRFSGSNGRIEKLECVRTEFSREGKDKCPVIKEVENSGFCIDADLVIIAAGFLCPITEKLLSGLKVELDERGNIRTDINMMTGVEKVFSAGDGRRGQSLVVWAISEGRRCAHNIDKFLMGKSFLPVI
jgi:glutamate synthase (NADPH) small chain